jgi:Flp pilus assembly protein TadG
MKSRNRHPDAVPATRPRRARGSGQALVEFAVAIIPFLMLLMAVVDLGRGIYMLNGTSEAAREIARVTSVHPSDASGDLGSSPQAAAVIATQRRLIPNLTINPAVDIVCVDYLDQVLPNSKCFSGVVNLDTNAGNYIRVHLTAPFVPVTPLVSAFGSHTFDSTSRIQVP